MTTWIRKITDKHTYTHAHTHTHIYRKHVSCKLINNISCFAGETSKVMGCMCVVCACARVCVEVVVLDCLPMKRMSCDRCMWNVYVLEWASEWVFLFVFRKRCHVIRICQLTLSLTHTHTQRIQSMPNPRKVLSSSFTCPLALKTRILSLN